jgi:hypothetical protein
MKKTAFYLLFAIIMPFGAFSQGEIGRFITSGAQDMENLTKAYLEPFGKGFGTAMNAGWFWTAETHQQFGFDFTINTTLVNVPSSAGTFSFDDYDFQVIEPGSSTTSATIMGSNDGATVGATIEDPFGNSLTLNDVYTLPDGSGLDFVPLPMMQLSVGVIKGTDLTFRFFPELEFGDYGKIGMLGFGLKHDFKQWIPVVNKLPFHMSLQGGWSRLSGTYTQIDYYPTALVEQGFEFEYIDPTLPTDGDQVAIENDFYRTQDLTLTTSAWNVNFIISKKLSVFTAFASLGYASSNFNISLNGKYLIPDYVFATGEYASYDNNGDYIVSVLDRNNIITDPIDADIKYSSFNTAIGFQLKLAIVSLHAAYIYQEYSMVNFGLGISFR